MMKKYCLLLSLLLITLATVKAHNPTVPPNNQPSQASDNQNNYSDPLLVVVLMVKNEMNVIKATLRPYVEAVANGVGKKLSFFVFDTGSTDNTIPVTKQYFEENNLHNAVIMQEPFIDFATSRNRALQLAQETFPHASFMLMPDAEWYMHNVEGLIQFCEIHKNNPCNSYLVRIMNAAIDFYTPRLIKCRSGIHFIGRVHEVLNEVTRQTVSSDCFFEWAAGAQGQEKTKKRWLRDLGLLLQDYEHNPFDPRTVFYVAQTYECLGDLNNAREWYERRITMHGWDEENFIARYRLAQICETLGDWPQAQCHYLTAFSQRPSRAEPLVRLAQHYWNLREINLCYLFSRRAVEIPYPQRDILFIDKPLYNYTRYDLLGISAWYVGEYKLGKEAVLQALKAWPDAPHLLSNLNLYLSQDVKAVPA